MLGARCAQATPIALDPTFGDQGVYPGTSVLSHGIISTSGGKFLVGNNNSPGINFLRFNQDGVRDTAFGQPGAGGGSRDIAVDSQGRILILTSSGDSIVVTRLTAAGVLDAAFGSNGVATVQVPLPSGTRFSALCLSVDSQGRPIVGGYTMLTSDPGFPTTAIVRLTAVGAFDSTFGTGGIFRFEGLGTPAIQAGEITRLGTDSKGRVVAVGTVGGTGFPTRTLIARFAATGKLDTIFGSGGIALPTIIPNYPVTHVSGLAFDGDAIVFCGTIDSSTAQTSHYAYVGKLTSSGAVAGDFGTGETSGMAFVHPENPIFFMAWELSVDEAGRILMLGTNQDSTTIFRLTPQGQVDTDFNDTGFFQVPASPGSSSTTAFGLLAKGQRVYVGSGALGAITNPVVNISVSDYTAAGKEQGLSQTAPHYTIHLSNPVKVPLTVVYATRNGTAYAGRDYTSLSTKVTFNPGETDKTITVPVLDDTLTEANETFDFRLTSATLGTITTPFVTTTIEDDDPIVAADSSFTTPAGVSYSGLLGTTPNPAWTYSIVTQPSLGAVSLNTSTGEFTYSAPVGLGGSDSFTYRISDGTAVSNVATVSATVTPNELPSLVVTTLSDVVAVDGQTSLREAINYAAQNDGPDNITFAPGLSGVIKLTSSLPPLTWGSVRGPGADLLTIDAQLSTSSAYDCRAFTINTEDLVQISGLKFSGGSSTNGGAIYANAPTSNFARVEVSDCVFSGNKATLGGAVYNVRVIDRCSFNNNSSTSNGGAYFGPTSGITTITNSTFENNFAAGWGGGAYSSLSLNLSNCTFYGNKANGHGGAVLSAGGKILHCTITGNQADANGNNDGSGGGIYRVGAASTPALNVYNCIVSGNTGVSGPDFFGTFATIQYSMIGVPSGMTGIGAGNFIYVDPKFDPAGIGNNGGPTRTIALQPTSVAINHGDKTQDTGLTTDQRGTGFSRINGGEADMGAVEAQTNQVPVASDATIVVAPGFTSTRFTLRATDGDGQPLTYQIVGQPSFGSVTLSGALATFTPNGNYAGVDQFTFRANDGIDDSNLATVTIKYNSAPQLVSLTPAKADGTVTGSGGTSITGEPLKVTLVVSDEDGADKLRVAYATFNKTLSNGGGVALSYDVAANKLSMRSADGKTVLGGQAPGAAVAPLDNGYAILDYSASTVVRDGNTLTVTFAITPKSTFTGAKKLWASVRDAQNAQVNFTQFGTWTVNPAVAPTMKASSGGSS